MFAIAAACASAQGSLPVYSAGRPVSGTIRIWGHGAWGRDFMDSLVEEWESGFRVHHPEVRFETSLRGTASAIGALYAGVGDLALMGREIRPFEIEAFRQVLHYDPVGLDVVNGSFDLRNKDFALGVFVNRDNPISKLSMAQLDAIFGCEHKRGAKNIRAWGELGLGGEWADRPIQVYGYQIWRGFADFFQDAVLAGSHKWNPGMQEVPAAKNPDGTEKDDGQAMLENLGKDRYGIVYCGMFYHHPMAKALALGVGDEGPWYEPTKENCITRKYPLARVIVGFINRPPGTAVAPALKEFMRYILSREGQASVLRQGDYLPLSAATAQEQLRKLE
jgi:phosphate transport system substrate-binding protein